MRDGFVFSEASLKRMVALRPTRLVQGCMGSVGVKF